MRGKSHICPICFALYGNPDPEWPVCPDYDGEAITVDVEPLDEFLENHSLEELQELLRKWNAAGGFRPQYKAAKQKRIEAVIDIKRGRRPKRRRR